MRRLWAALQLTVPSSESRKDRNITAFHTWYRTSTVGGHYSLARQCQRIQLFPDRLMYCRLLNQRYCVPLQATLFPPSNNVCDLHQYISALRFTMSSLSDVSTDDHAPASSPRPKVGTPCTIGIANIAEYSQSLAHVDIGRGVLIASRRETLTSCLSDHRFDVTPPLPSPPDSPAACASSDDLEGTPPLPSPPDSPASCASSDDLEGTPTLTTPPDSPSYFATRNAFQSQPTTLTPPESPSSLIGTGCLECTTMHETRAGSSRCWTSNADVGHLEAASTEPEWGQAKQAAATQPEWSQAKQAKVGDRRACLMAALARSAEMRQRVLKVATEHAMVSDAREARNEDFRREIARLRRSSEVLQTSDLGQLGAAATLPDCTRDRTCTTDVKAAFLTPDTALSQNGCRSPETEPRRAGSENVKDASVNASDRMHHDVNVPTVKPQGQVERAKVGDLRACLKAALARSVETRQRVLKLTTEDPIVSEARKARNEDFGREIAILRKSTEELQTSTKEIQADMTKLRGQSAEMEMAMKSCRPIFEQVNADMAEIMAERMVFRRQLDKLQSQNMKFRENNARCEIQIQKIKEETRAIKTAQKGFRVRIDELHDSNNVLLAESMTLRGRVDQARFDMDAQKNEMATMRKQIGRVHEEQCRMRSRVYDLTEGYQQILPFARDHYAMSNDQATRQTHGRDGPQFTLKRKRPGIEQEDAYNYWLSTNKRQRSSAVDGGRVR
jgi:predicted nuclease with TOPRIM domain